MPEIVVKFEDKVIERVVTEKKKISIGRTPDNDIVLDNKGVSRKHALVEFDGDSALIMDNESLNGTFVNSRKITEELLKDNDQITIGKFDLVFHRDAVQETRLADMDGTMVLKTRKQKQLLEKDKKAREITKVTGGSVLMGEENTERKQYPLEGPMTTFGRAKFVNIRVKGFLLSKIQAKVLREKETFVLVSVGRKGKVKVNGESVQRYRLRNDDLIEVGKSVFRFIQGQK